MKKNKNKNNMDLEKIIEKNIVMIDFILSNHPNNRVGLMKSNIGIDEDCIDKIYRMFLNGELKKLTPKRTYKSIKKAIDILRQVGCYINKDVKSVSIPYNVKINGEAEKCIDKLKGNGFTVIRATVID